MASSKHHRGTTMSYYAGIDVSLEASHVCVIDGSGKVVREARVASEPEALIAWLGSVGLELTRIGLEAGPLSQWLYAAMRDAGLAVELLETRHVRNAFKIMPVKTDRKDAQGIAELMRLGRSTESATSLCAIVSAICCGVRRAGSCASWPSFIPQGELAS